ncbi:hypothetical protein Tco_1114490 [Tanacetum coccineum]|uniref:Uncharacterized protein n=1 Tax=Tanacetum coccineum TaxID=301880 RepID=A0ABQ5IV82_9ASTR
MLRVLVVDQTSVSFVHRTSVFSVLTPIETMLYLLHSYSLPPEETGCSLPPERTSYSLSPEKTGCSLPLKRTSYSLPLKETGCSLPHEGTSYSLPPEGTSYSLPPKETGCSLPPKGTSYSLPPKETGCFLLPDETSYSLPPEETGCSLLPERTSYSLVIASGPEVAFITPTIPVDRFNMECLVAILVDDYYNNNRIASPTSRRIAENGSLTRAPSRCYGSSIDLLSWVLIRDRSLPEVISIGGELDLIRRSSRSELVSSEIGSWNCLLRTPVRGVYIESRTGCLELIGRCGYIELVLELLGRSSGGVNELREYGFVMEITLVVSFGEKLKAPSRPGVRYRRPFDQKEWVKRYMCVPIFTPAEVTLLVCNNYLKSLQTQDISPEDVPFDRGFKGVSKGKDATTNKLNEDAGPKRRVPRMSGGSADER